MGDRTEPEEARVDDSEDDLWDELVEAQEFCSSVMRDIDSYKLFPQERFESLQAGILATTGVDSHGEQLSEAGLRAFEEQLREGRIWLAFMHDPTVQPPGRTIAAKVFPSKRGIHALVGVTGSYEVASLPNFSQLGEPRPRLPGEATSSFTEVPRLGTTTLGFDPNDLEPSIIEEALAELPSQVSLSTERHFRKALEPLSIVSIGLSLLFLSKIPFLDELQKEAAKALFAWLKDSLLPRILARQTILLEFVSETNGCRVQFVARLRAASDVLAATEQLPSAAQSALELLENHRDLGFDKLVYEFDQGANRWLPLHAATARLGVISNRPQLIALDQMSSFSLAGVARKTALVKASEALTLEPVAVKSPRPPKLTKRLPRENQRRKAKAAKSARNKEHKRRKNK